MVAPKTYPKVGKCIYCGIVGDIDHPLGDEHVIPRGFGGRLILKKASCHKCGRITSAFETECINNMMHGAPLAFGVKGRKSRKAKKDVPFFAVGYKGHVGRVPVEDHPCIILMYRFGEPSLWAGAEPAVKRERTLHMIKLQPEAVRFYEPQPKVIPFIGVNAKYQALMLGKIAHSFAVAELGLNGFNPLLPDLIRGDPPDPALLELVGERIPNQPPTDEMHEIELLREQHSSGQAYWIVRVRLFASKEATPTYDIIVGKPLAGG